MGFRKWDRPNRGGGSRITGTGFNGGDLRSFNRLVEYMTIWAGYPKYAIFKTIGGEMGFVFGDHESREETHASVMPIWGADEIIPARVRLIKSDTELLLGTDVVGGITSNC